MLYQTDLVFSLPAGAGFGIMPINNPEVSGEFILD